MELKLQVSNPNGARHAVIQNKTFRKDHLLPFNNQIKTEGFWVFFFSDFTLLILN